MSANTDSPFPYADSDRAVATEHGRCPSGAALAGSALSPFGSSPSAPAANALLPCPFCGETAVDTGKVYNVDNVLVGFVVECPECETMGPQWPAEHHARAAWNRRAERDWRPVMAALLKALEDSDEEGLIGHAEPVIEAKRLLAPASVDTHPVRGGDEAQTSAPFMGGAVPSEETADAQPLASGDS